MYLYCTCFVSLYFVKYACANFCLSMIMFLVSCMICFLSSLLIQNGDIHFCDLLISFSFNSTRGWHDPSVSIPILLLQYHILRRLTQPQPQQPSGWTQLWSPGQPGQATNHGGLLLKLLPLLFSPWSSESVC